MSAVEPQSDGKAGNEKPPLCNYLTRSVLPIQNGSFCGDWFGYGWTQRIADDQSRSDAHYLEQRVLVEQRRRQLTVHGNEQSGENRDDRPL